MDVMYGVLLLWFILTLGSLIFVLWDQFTNTPSMRIMTWAWALVIIYTGPVGLFFYFLSCREPLPGTHDQFIKAHWKQTLGSLIHCVAGDATAIIIMAIILYFFSVSNGVEIVLEYVAAYLFGLFIFQAVFMRSMFKSYGEAVLKTIFAETVSMNMVMIGMFAVMVILGGLYPVSLNPLKIYFWGRMSLAAICGFITAYPINSWMVKNKIKHGMMSKPQAGSSDHAHMQHDHQEMDMMSSKSLSMGKQIWICVWTYALLALVLYIVSLFVPIMF